MTNDALELCDSLKNGPADIRTGNHLTVGELRTILSKADTDKKVYLEGCDCVGELDGIEFNFCGDSVMLTRRD